MKRTFVEVPMFTKKEKDDLTEDEKKVFKAIVRILKED